MRNAATLDPVVIEDWHDVPGTVPTRQKALSIKVGEIWPGRDYRVPVRFIVPKEGKAKGMLVTGGNHLDNVEKTVELHGLDIELLKGGVGLVKTIVQDLNSFGQGELEKESEEKFLATLDPHAKKQFWAWPATISRAITAAYAENEFFAPGKVAVTGASKNGASPSISLIADKRITAQFACVSPIWSSPLRMCDKAAWEELKAYDQQYFEREKTLGHDMKPSYSFLGGYSGPNYNDKALAKGHSWDELKHFAQSMEKEVFVASCWDELMERNVEILFQPGTHDFVMYDLIYGGSRYPQIPIYLKANTGHSYRKAHPAAEHDEQNEEAFLLQHFFLEKNPLLAPPSITTEVAGDSLKVTVTFAQNDKADSGRIFWIYDRGPDGSLAYINELIPNDNFRDMNQSGNSWVVDIQLEKGHTTIDIFSNHRKVVDIRGKAYITYISSPYTRIELRSEEGALDDVHD